MRSITLHLKEFASFGRNPLNGNSFVDPFRNGKGMTRQSKRSKILYLLKFAFFGRRLFKGNKFVDSIF